MSMGEPGRGDLVYVRYLSAGWVSFGYDHWGVGGPDSAPAALDAGPVQVVDIDCGALDSGSGEAGRAGRGRLVIRLNGRTVLDREVPYYACEPDTVVLGLNALGASTAAAVFTGTIVSHERTPSVPGSREPRP